MAGRLEGLWEGLGRAGMGKAVPEDVLVALQTPGNSLGFWQWGLLGWDLGSCCSKEGLESAGAVS